MSLNGLVVFCAVYALSVASPGPGVAAVVARSLDRGSRGAPAFIAGFLVGDLVWFTLAATGLAAIAETAYALFVAIKYAGAAYLLYLAYRMWTAPGPAVNVAEAEPSQSPSRLFLGSLALTLGNPKPMVFFLALLPTVVTLQTLTMASFLAIAAVMAIVLPVVLGAYVLAAVRARRLLRNPRALRVMNRGSATVMAGAAVVIARS
ncbi:MAG TPA: LysE family translocator [Vicinamibacterales bacterium]|nr:LysE family translocator [Vicinamibacterales bacterium]